MPKKLYNERMKELRETTLSQQELANLVCLPNHILGKMLVKLGLKNGYTASEYALEQGLATKRNSPRWSEQVVGLIRDYQFASYKRPMNAAPTGITYSEYMDKQNEETNS